MSKWHSYPLATPCFYFISLTIFAKTFLHDPFYHALPPLQHWHFDIATYMYILNKCVCVCVLSFCSALLCSGVRMINDFWTNGNCLNCIKVFLCVRIKAKMNQKAKKGVCGICYICSSTVRLCATQTCAADVESAKYIRVYSA